MGLLQKMGKIERKAYAKLSKKELPELRARAKPPKILAEKGVAEVELKAFLREVKSSKGEEPELEERPEPEEKPEPEEEPKPEEKAKVKVKPERKEKPKKKSGLFVPTRVSKFDELISTHGLERGSTVLVSGGAGTGKTTFCLQSLYYGAMNGEKGVYISLEEETDKLKEHMLRNFGWDFYKLEKEGKIAIIKYDAMEIARSVEAALVSAKEKLSIKFDEFRLPFKPDRVVLDSLSALSIAFGSTENYRRYIRYLFEKLESYNSINFVLTETEQNPKVYSRAGIEEFLADCVIVLYNIQIHNLRENALEILKLRAAKHEKKIVPFEITYEGIEIYPNQDIFLNDYHSGP
jgi:KaiC/GvpD/RAD55 family RecA-like ATPase